MFIAEIHLPINGCLASPTKLMVEKNQEKYSLREWLLGVPRERDYPPLFKALVDAIRSTSSVPPVPDPAFRKRAKAKLLEIIAKQEKGSTD